MKASVVALLVIFVAAVTLFVGSRILQNPIVAGRSPLSSLAQVVLSVNIINPNVPEPAPVVTTSGGGGGNTGASRSAVTGATAAASPIAVVQQKLATVGLDSYSSALPQAPSPASAPVHFTAITVAAPIAATTPTAPPSAAVITPSVAISVLNRNIVQGQSGADVQLLQRFLNTHGFPVSRSGTGSLGKEDASFGPKTKAALLAYQKAHFAAIIGTAAAQVPQGNLGPKTRAYILQVIAAGE